MSGTPPTAQLNRILQGLGGNSFSRGSRLPSLRSPRDLTLGANASSKRFKAPSIPVKRERTEDSTNQDDERPSKQMRSSERGRGRGGRGRGDRGRGRGRGRGLIQLASSIFSEGPAQMLKRGRGGGGGGGESNYIVKPKVSFDFSVQDDEEETTEEFRKLTRDDFIDDDDSNEFLSAYDLPVRLPMKTKQMFTVKTEFYETKETKVKIKVKDEPLSDDDDEKKKVVNDGVDLAKVKIKDEPISTDVEMEEPVDQIKIKKEIKDEKKIAISSDSSTESRPTIGDVLKRARQSGREELFLVQLPKPLPGLPKSKDDVKPKIKQEPGTTKATIVTDNINNKQKGTTLEDISEGYVGKIQILKSGKTRMIFGDVTLDLELGNETLFLQDLVSLRLRDGGTSGAMCSLGHVEHRLLCKPEIKAMAENE